MKSLSRFIAFLALAAICGGMADLALRRSSMGGNLGGGSPGAGKRVSFYQDSMHPWVKSDQPGKCTICAMDLTPIFEGQSGFGASEHLVALTPSNITVLNVQTEEVQPRSIVHTLAVAGTIEASETTRTTVAAPAPGRIHEITVDYAGVEVREGEPLVTFYSPELTLEKRRYVVRARISPKMDPSLGIARPASDSDPYYNYLICPKSGTVIERKVYKGQYVVDGEKLFTIVDLSTVWFRFDAYEQQIPWLAVGQNIEVVVPALPGRVFSAVISFIEPMLNEPTRSFKVRADLNNPLIEVNGHRQRLLALWTYGRGSIRAELNPSLAVPRSAVLLPGRSAFAYVDRGNGVYEKRRIKLGHQGDAYWEVLAGLKAGEKVVTSGNVLIDAQAQFNSSSGPDELDSEEPAPAVGDAGPAPAPSIQRPIVAKDPSEAMPAAMPEMAEAPAKGEDPPMAGEEKGEDPPMEMPAAKGRPAPRALPKEDRGATSRVGNENALFNRMAEMRTNELLDARRSKAETVQKLTEPQRRMLRDLLASADGIARALAEDDLPGFLKASKSLPDALTSLQKDLGAPHPLGEALQRIAMPAREPAGKTLEEARKWFAPFSTAVVELVRQIRKEDPAFAELKTYHCPMAPKPGLWMQARGPIANPFFGAIMKSCGEEVSP